MEVVSVRTVWWEPGVVCLLDQTKLPRERATVRCTTVAEVAGAIRSMVVRGAPAIGVTAAYGMALAARKHAARDAAALLEELSTAKATLDAARPTAVNLSWAVDQVLAAEDPLERARELHREQEEADRRLSRLGAERFERGDRALTHCNAGALATAGVGTAGGVLQAAWERGCLAQVWVDETRPLLQGARLTAYELEKAGIPFRVVPDSSAAALMARGLVDRIVVGADRIAANGDVANKIGTYPLAVLAARHGLPFYVAAPVSTLDPDTARGEDIPIEERDPAEIADGVPALNLAFDVTPAELISAIVTEAGVLEPPYDEAIARVAAR
jgi:methylthioribose-1-phosphate isomerase